MVEIKRKQGRPKKKIDLQIVANMCGYFCTRDEIAGSLGVDDETLLQAIQDAGYKDFSTFFKQHNAGGKISLRRSMFENATKNQKFEAQRFLAKNFLGMRDDNVDVEQELQNLNFKIEFLNSKNGNTVVDNNIKGDDGNNND